MLEELHTVFDSLQHPNSMLEPVEEDFPRVVVLRGAGGKAFSGGVDIKVLSTKRSTACQNGEMPRAPCSALSLTP
jgi:enoyl-CoA hydratase/carnithine racemase